MSVRAAKTALVLTLLACLTLPLAACGSDEGDDAGATAAVTATSGARASEIRNNKFESPMKVMVGSEVTWVNKDGVAHNVIAKDGSFKSGTLRKEDTSSHTFATAGRFEYTCTFHPGMNGVVEVE